MKRYSTHAVWGLMFAIFGASSATAQDFPNRPIRMVVTNSPGVIDDVLARALGQAMSKSLGQPVVIDNRPGGGGLIAYQNVARQSAADGYTTIMTQPIVLATLPLAFKEVGFDPATDIPPLLGLGEARLIFGSGAQFPWKNIQELVAYAKANPGKLNYGSGALSSRIPTEILLKALGIKVTFVPYTGGAPYLQGLISGDVQMGFLVEQPALAWGPKFRVLTVSGEGRSKNFPNAPTLTELGVKNVTGVEFSLNVRAGTPRAAVGKLSAAASQALRQPEIKAQFAKVNLDILERPGDEAGKRLGAQVKNFVEIGKELGIEPQ